MVRRPGPPENVDFEGLGATRLARDTLFLLAVRPAALGRGGGVHRRLRSCVADGEPRLSR
jgi:hypothetical protein